MNIWCKYYEVGHCILYCLNFFIVKFISKRRFVCILRIITSIKFQPLCSIKINHTLHCPSPSEMLIGSLLLQNKHRKNTFQNKHTDEWYPLFPIFFNYFFYPIEQTFFVVGNILVEAECLREIFFVFTLNFKQCFGLLEHAVCSKYGR